MELFCNNHIKKVELKCLDFTRNLNYKEVDWGTSSVIQMYDPIVKTENWKYGVQGIPTYTNPKEYYVFNKDSGGPHGISLSEDGKEIKLSISGQKFKDSSTIGSTQSYYRPKPYSLKITLVDPITLE